jgi:hypothetical protein
LENRAERGELDKRGGELRYAVEADLAQIYKQEELYWQRMGVLNGFWKEMAIPIISIA